MKVLILFRPNSEHERRVEDYLRDYKMLKVNPSNMPELVNLDTREGAYKAKIYDVTQYPAILAISSDGSLQKMWQGEQFPLLNELDYYLQTS